MQTDFRKVFICYSRIDSAYANQVYYLLRDNGYHVFLDTICIHPGDDWEPIALKTLAQANFLIVILTRDSIARKGYMQKEYLTSLAYYESRKNSRLTILPLKIGNCIPPPELTKFQWTEYSTQGLRSILTTLRIQREKWQAEIQRKRKPKAEPPKSNKWKPALLFFLLGVTVSASLTILYLWLQKT